MAATLSPSNNPIKDNHDLFRAIAKSRIGFSNTGIPQIPLDAYRIPNPNHKGLSCDWSRLSNPQQCRATYAQIKSKNPNDYSTIKVNVGIVRKLNLDAIHDPKPNNQAHSLMIGGELTGAKRVELRRKLVAKTIVV